MSRRRWERERGSGGMSLAWIVAMPAAMLLIFGGVQFGIHSFAENLALAAAQVGVRSATAYPADAARGRRAAQDFLRVKAADSIENGAVSVSLDGTTITVTVTGKSQSIVPGMQFSVSGSATGPVEQLDG
jgi:Flp pilus assembly protein TadG